MGDCFVKSYTNPNIETAMTTLRITYFLFGVDPVSQYDSNEQVTSTDGEVFRYDENEMEARDLLDRFSGYETYTEITEDEYNELKKHFDGEYDPCMGDFNIGDNRISLYHAQINSGSKAGHYLISIEFRLNGKDKGMHITSTDSRLFDGAREAEDSFEYIVVNARNTIEAAIKNLIERSK